MTYRELLNSIIKKLEAANVPDSKTDAWRLFEDFSRMSRSVFLMRAADEVEDDKLISILNEKTDMRMKRIPLQYITGKQEFYGLTFMVSNDTLIPRFDTEILADEARKLAAGKKVLDICTGTGCILLSVAAAANVSLAVGTDISEGAVRLAEQNAKLNGIDNSVFFSGDLFEALEGTEFENTKFDIIVSNPPYVTPEEMEALEPEVKQYEPEKALLGGKDGLDFYRRISKEAPEHLCEGGWLLYEIGCSQGSAVSELLKENGFVQIRVIKDLSGLDRVVIGKKGKM